jgi:hypothetical protein
MRRAVITSIRLNARNIVTSLPFAVPGALFAICAHQPALVVLLGVMLAFVAPIVFLASKGSPSGIPLTTTSKVARHLERSRLLSVPRQRVFAKLAILLAFAEIAIAFAGSDHSLSSLLSASELGAVLMLFGVWSWSDANLIERIEQLEEENKRIRASSSTEQK